MKFVGGILEEGWGLRVSLGGFLGAGEWRGFGVSIGMGLGWFGSVSGIWGLGVERAEDVGGWWWVPCFTLEYVKLVWLWH